jgi:pimeloyl-ACP methyl ester carboxylesterase
MTHIEHDFDSAIWRPVFRGLSRNNTFVRYDARGNGLSDREVPDVRFDDFVSDLETVVDAAGLDRFALHGLSQGCAVSIAYAVRHPERVSHLILLGGYSVGWKRRARTQAEKEAGEAMVTLVRLGWGQENPAFRQMFTSQFIPGASKEQADWFNEFQRISSSPADAARNLIANGEADVTSLLPQVRVPTLVMHSRHDARVPFEAGRRMAAGIPGARFVPLESQNHVILPGEPAMDRFLEEARSFLGVDVRP